jgi:hypothetical protein
MSLIVKKRLFIQTSLTDLSLQRTWAVFSVRWELKSHTKYTRMLFFRTLTRIHYLSTITHNFPSVNLIVGLIVCCNMKACMKRSIAPLMLNLGTSRSLQFASTLLPIEQQTGWAPETVWRIWRKVVIQPGIDPRFISRSARSLVTIVTELSRLIDTCVSAKIMMFAFMSKCWKKILITELYEVKREKKKWGG